MSTASFLADLLQKGVEFEVADGKLRCRAPQGSLTPSSRQELSASQEEIVSLLDESKKYVTPSFAQQRLWFLDQLEPGSPLYNIPFRFPLRGRLDVAVLERSFDEIVRRHEVLRTVFDTVDGRPVQVIDPALAVPLAIVDLQGIPQAERQAEAQRLAVKDAQRPFDLARGPLVRLSLLRLGKKEHLLLLTMHHIISDGWSMEIVMHELVTLYRALSADGDDSSAVAPSSPLPDLPIQYADYAVWQKRWLQGEVLEAQLDYWKEQLHDAPALLELPTDRPRPPVQTYRGATHSFGLSRPLTETLQALSHQQGCTLFITLLAAFKTLLYRYTGQTDILVGSPIAGRTRSELEGLVGFFVNTLVLRTNLSGNPGFRQVLGRVRQVALGAYAHQDLPFELLVEALQPERNPSYTPLFQVAFAFQDALKPPIEFPDLSRGSLDLEGGHTTAKFDLTLGLAQTEQGLSGSFEYNTDLFDASTIVQMSRHFEVLLTRIAADPDQRLDMIPLFEKKAIADELGMPASNIDRLSPLTATQRDLYLSHMIDPENTIYSLGVSLDLGPNLDRGGWERALAIVAQRGDVAKSRFFSHRGQVFQFVDKEQPFTFEFIDLQEPAVPIDDLQDVVAEKVKVKYDLCQGPLFNNFLIRDQRGHYVAILATPHILTDAHSARIFFERVGAVYEALAEGREPQSQPEKRSFYDFVEASLARFDTKEIREYWSERLKAVTPLEFRGEAKNGSICKTIRIDGQELRSIKAYCQAAGCSLAALFRGLYAVLVNEYFEPTGPFLVYHVVGGRTKENAETLGCFYQVVPTLFDKGLFDPRSSINDYINYVRNFRRNLGPLQNISVLMQTTLLQREKLRFFYNFYDFSVAEILGEERALTVHDSFPDDEIHLIVNDLCDSLELALHYNQACFSDLNFLERLLAICRQIVGGATCFDQLDLILKDERRRLLLEWNDTRVDYARDVFIHHLFEAQAERRPDAIALIFEGEQLTYRELNRRANQLAHYLRALGVGPETLVGICMERSLDMVVGLLGSLKAGGAYLPLDPTYPRKRLAFMLRDARAPLLLTQTHLLAELPEHRAQVICLDTDWPAIAQQSERNPVSELTNDSLAYVIYTSGSTGHPKGTMNTHQGIRNRLLWMQDTYQLAETDRVLQKTPFSFDVSVWEFFWPLLTGACLVVARPEGHKDSAYLVELISAHHVTTLHFVPAMLRLFLEERKVESCGCLKRVICSGEALPFSLQERFFERLDVDLYNLYGPTEAAIDVTGWACQRDSELSLVPIGSPIANIQIYLLDAQMQPVPVGLPGELHVGGVGLARGYLDRPGLTAEKFVPDPFSGEPGARLYKTGDLARHLPDGNIVFLERIDHQVKIRGFRIELGEIETVLGQHPLVKQALVAVIRDRAQDKRLVAYVVAQEEAKLPAGELQGFLKEKLPQHMVPTAFVELTAMPLTPSGKLDRRSLPLPDRSSRPLSSRALVPPRDRLELQLIQIWQDILDLSPVGVADDFFSLGGHSLLAVRLLSQIEQRLGQRLPLTTLFQNPTVERMASLLRREDVLPGWSPLVELQSGHSKRPFFCVHPAGGNVMCYVDLARHLGVARPFYGLQAAGLEENQEPLTRIEEMAATYVEALRTVQPQGPYALGGWSFGGVVAFEMAHQLQAQGQNVAALILLDSWAQLYFDPDWLVQLDDETVLVTEFMRDLVGGGEGGSARPIDRPDQLDRDGRLKHILEQAHDRHLLSPDVELAQIRRLFQVYALNLSALKRYQPPIYPKPITLFRASETPENLSAEPSLGWANLCSDSVDTRIVPGNHYTMLASPRVQVLAEKLQTRLNL